MELVEEKPVKRAILTVEDLTEVERLEDLDTCMVSPCGCPAHPQSAVPLVGFNVSLFENGRSSDLERAFRDHKQEAASRFQKHTCCADV